MYEEHFGLTSRPFGAKAEGAGVFVGPQQAKIINSLNKGLGAADAVVTVTGPVGVGKTTIVSRALESISPGRMVAWVGRMQLAPDEVLELLLTGFGVSREAKGTIQRFSAFRRLLAERAAAGAQVAIVVEDAHRIGVDALIELEALTAADAGDATSANIILMGQPGLNQILAQPELARMRQRNRLRQSIEAFNEAEVSGYLKHCLREAGGDYNAIFDSGVANIVYRCSEGIPRIINTLCETVLTTAMQDGQSRVTATMMHQVAADAFGYEATQTATQTDTVPDMETEACLTPDPVNDKSTTNTPPETTSPKAQTSDDAIPELIEDTRPDLKPIDDDQEAIASSEVEATQTQKTLSVPIPDEVGAEPDKEDDDAEFSLDAALSVEAEETNVMPGITPNLDQLAARARIEDAAENDSITEPTENIPTLSNSMRIDVEVEVKRAQAAEPQAAATESKPAALPEPQPVTTNKTEKKPDPAPIAAPEPKPTIAAAPAPKPEPKPVSAAKQEQQPEAKSTPLPTVANDPRPEPQPIVAAGPVAKSKPVPEPVREPAPEAITAGQAEPQPASAPASLATAESVSAEAKNVVQKPGVATNVATSTSDGLAETTVGDVAAELAEQAADAWSTFEHGASEESDKVSQVDGENEALALADNDLSLLEPAEQNLATGLTSGKAPPAPTIGTKKEKREPDIDALEAALTAAKKGDFAAQPKTTTANPGAINTTPETNAKAESVADIPEITLDASLPTQSADDDELKRVAEQIGAANSLEDISDVMAETIFGSQALDDIAAAVVANPPQDDSESPVMLTDAEVPVAANDANENQGSAKSAPPVVQPGKVDESAAKRLNMVKALHNDTGNDDVPVVEEIEISSGNPNGKPVPAKTTGPQPEPIENQINTSMTQTLQALNSAQIKKAQQSEEEEKKSGGLFSRFRRSS